jgi:hypothetical protein
MYKYIIMDNYHNSGDQIEKVLSKWLNLQKVIKEEITLNSISIILYIIILTSNKTTTKLYGRVKTILL